MILIKMELCYIYVYMYTYIHTYTHIDTLAYPELVSRGVSKSRKFRWVVKVGASKGVTP